MKAKDLMIGDLINGFGVVRRVTSINGLERPEDDGLLTTMVGVVNFPKAIFLLGHAMHSRYR